MFLLTLIPDQSCDWSRIEDLLKKWNDSLRRQESPAQDKVCFSLRPVDDQEYFPALVELQEILEPYEISFFLEDNP